MPKRIKPLQPTGRKVNRICAWCLGLITGKYLHPNRKFCCEDHKRKYELKYGYMRWEVQKEKLKARMAAKEATAPNKKMEELARERMKMHPRLLALYGKK